MNDESRAQDHAPDGEGTLNPLEQLTSLVLDAADAANDSAQSTHETIAKLAQVVETNEQTSRAVRSAPAILGAVLLSVGVVFAVLIAIVFSKINEKAATLGVAIAAQNEALARNEAALKSLQQLESNLSKFQNVAEETSQRAVVTLREQVKADRLALQQLEVRRLNEMLASLRGGIASASRPAPAQADDLTTRIVALEKSLAGVDARLRSARLESLDDGLKRVDARLAGIEKAATGAGSGGRASAAGESQSRDMKVVLDELAALKAEVVSLRGLLERRGSEAPSTAPSFRRPGAG